MSNLDKEKKFNRLYRESFDYAREEIVLFAQDNEFLLCYFDSVLDIQHTKEITKYACNNDLARVIVLKITALQNFYSMIDTVFFRESSLINEYVGKGNNAFNCFDIYNSMKKDKYNYPKSMTLYLLIKKSELINIYSAIKNQEEILVNYTTYSRFAQEVYNYEDEASPIQKDTLYSVQFYHYGKYDIKKLYTPKDNLHVYDSIDKIVRLKLNK